MCPPQVDNRKKSELSDKLRSDAHSISLVLLSAATLKIIAVVLQEKVFRPQSSGRSV